MHSRGEGHTAADPHGGLRTAAIFAALGDPTRLALLTRLSRGEWLSLSELAQGSPLTRQAIAKHLRVLEAAHMVRWARAGRESLYALDPQPVQEVRAFLERISAQWDQALLRLKALAESGADG